MAASSAILEAPVRSAVGPVLLPDAITAAAGAPSATFRLQFGPGFGFSDALRLTPFLDGIGITAVYASPIFKARAGSQHGYDVTDPRQLNPELGSEAEFRRFARELRRRGMGLILDIVPNHMAASAGNPWWEDVLEDGPCSRYARYFDIDWVRGAGRLVIPVLSEPCEGLVARRDLRVALDGAGLCVCYWEHRFPLALRSYRFVLDACPKCEELLRRIERLPETAVAAHARMAAKESIKAELWRAFAGDPEVRSRIEAGLESVNGDPDRFHDMLGRQAYTLEWWRTGRDRICYRRFFDVNELIGLRVELPEVFDDVHRLLFRLVREGLVSGVRIDHLDGLWDPEEYLGRLAARLEASSKNVYLVAEKILLNGETAPRSWSVDGTTGYDFLDASNGLFVNAANMPCLDSLYGGFTGTREPYEDVVYSQKKRVIRHLFAAELAALKERLCALASCDPEVAGSSGDELEIALVEMTACLPVYRTYIRSRLLTVPDRRAIDAAEQSATRRTPSLPGPGFSFLNRLLRMQLPDNASPGLRDAWLDFVRRWQQFTGPVTAKGAEDTACYVHNRLISLNVVGGSLRPVAPEQFHRFNLRRLAWSPNTLNATSTHDTKHSEDVRARINVLSEMPGVWAAAAARWAAWNRVHKRAAGGGLAPCANHEYLLYQALLGAWPLDDSELPSFRERMRGFAVKAARESKTHTDWLAPHESYEAALLAFLDGILNPGADNPFFADIRRLEEYLAPFGALGSLAQVVLKCTCPGVPDFYQGTLLWDFSLVDPDNRRPVDFARRMRLWHEVGEMAGAGRPGLAREMTATWRDGRIKMYTAATLLRFRKVEKALFAEGGYEPLEVRGPGAGHVIAFARHHGASWAVTAVPRLLASLAPDCSPLAHSAVWNGTAIRLPAGAPRRWLNLFSGSPVSGGCLPLAELFRSFPVAVLAGGRV